MLEAIGLTKHYGDQIALHPLNLRIEPGEIYCLLGANGAGKTTTINLFLNFIAPDGGQALIHGLDVAREPLASKRHVAYIPEQVNLYGTLTGLENLRYFAALALGGSAATRAAAGTAGRGRTGPGRRGQAGGRLFQGHAPEGVDRRGAGQECPRAAAR